MIQIKGFEAAKIIFIPESNLGFEGTWAAHEIRRSGLRNICIMDEDNNRAVVRLNRPLKISMCKVFKEKLNLDQIFFHRSFFCIGDGNSPESIMNEIVNQLLNYTRRLTYSKDRKIAPKETYGGKQGHGFGDHAIAIQLNLVLKIIFYIKDKYAVWRK